MNHGNARFGPLRWAERLYVVGLALLVGAQCAVGYLVAPTLFAVVPERALAGTIAGAIFARLGWTALAGYAVLVLLQHWLHRARPAAPRWPRVALPAMLVLTAIGHLWLRPWIAEVRAQVQTAGGFELAPAELRARFGMLHGVSSLVFLAVTLIGVVLLLQLREGTHSD